MYGLHAVINPVDLPRNIAAATIFRTLRFSVTSSFFSLTRGGGGPSVPTVLFESTRLPPMWSGFDSQIQRHMWVEFVGSLLCTERFSPGTPVSPLVKKPPFDLISVKLLT